MNSKIMNAILENLTDEELFALERLIGVQKTNRADRWFRMNDYDPLNGEERRALMAGSRLIPLIKMYKSRTGCSLRLAKLVCEYWIGQRDAGLIHSTDY